MAFHYLLAVDVKTYWLFTGWKSTLCKNKALFQLHLSLHTILSGFPRFLFFFFFLTVLIHCSNYELYNEPIQKSLQNMSGTPPHQ